MLALSSELVLTYSPQPRIGAAPMKANPGDALIHKLAESAGVSPEEVKKVLLLLGFDRVEDALSASGADAASSGQLRLGVRRADGVLMM